MADDARFWMKPMQGTDYSSGGVDISSYRTRVAINTNFGGGVLPDDNGAYGDGPRFVRGAIIDANLEGAANFRLSPSDPADERNNYLGYSWAVRLMDIADTDGTEGFGSSLYGSYISLAEPSNSDVAIRLGNITGDIAFTDGKIDVLPAVDNRNNKPGLTISHNMLMGYAAESRVLEGLPSLAGRREVRVDNMALGDATLGRIVIPSARAYASITLEPPRNILP